MTINTCLTSSTFLLDKSLKVLVVGQSCLIFFKLWLKYSHVSINRNAWSFLTFVLAICAKCITLVYGQNILPGSECWALRKSGEKKIEAFELWCYRRLFRISWTDSKSNEWVLEKMDCKERLLATLNRRKMYFVGHVLRRKDISCNLFMGSVYADRERGRPKTSTMTTLRKELELYVS